MSHYPHRATKSLISDVGDPLLRELFTRVFYGQMSPPEAEPAPVKTMKTEWQEANATIAALQRDLGTALADLYLEKQKVETQKQTEHQWMETKIALEHDLKTQTELVEDTRDARDRALAELHQHKHNSELDNGGLRDEIHALKSQLARAVADATRLSRSLEEAGACIDVQKNSIIAKNGELGEARGLAATRLAAIEVLMKAASAHTARIVKLGLDPNSDAKDRSADPEVTHVWRQRANDYKAQLDAIRKLL